MHEVVMCRMVTSELSADVSLQKEMRFSHFVMLGSSSRRRAALHWAEGRWRPLGPISDNTERTDHRHMPDPVRAAHTNQLMSSNRKSDRKRRHLLHCDLSNCFLKTFHVTFLGLQVIDFWKNRKIQSCMAKSDAITGNTTKTILTPLQNIWYFL